MQNRFSNRKIYALTGENATKLTISDQTAKARPKIAAKRGRSLVTCILIKTSHESGYLDDWDTRFLIVLDVDAADSVNSDTDDTDDTVMLTLVLVALEGWG